MKREVRLRLRLVTWYASVLQAASSTSSIRHNCRRTRATRFSFYVADVRATVKQRASNRVRVRNGAGEDVRAVVLLREDTRRASQGTEAPLPVQHPSLFPGCARRRGAREGSTLRAKRGAWLPTAPAASRSRFARRLGGSSDLFFGVEPTTESGSSWRRNYERHRRMSWPTRMSRPFECSPCTQLRRRTS